MLMINDTQTDMAPFMGVGVGYTDTDMAPFMGMFVGYHWNPGHILTPINYHCDSECLIGDNTSNFRISLL